MTKKVETDYYGRVKGWQPIKKKPKMYSIGVGVKACSKCGKLYFDTWSMYCQLDGKWLANTEFLDLKHRKLLGFNEPSKQPGWLLTNAL